MSTAEDILNVARSQLGVCENPRGSNSGTPYHAWWGQQGIQWCSIFVSWCFAQLNAKNLIHVYSAYSGDILEAGRNAGQEVAVGQPGDIVVFDWGDGGITDHIGIVEKRLGPWSFQTIEGNQNDCVARKVRDRGESCQMWFIRPKYESAPVHKEEDGMLFEKDGKTFKCEDLYTSRYTYWLHIRNDGTTPVMVDLKFLPLSGKPRKEVVAGGFTLQPGGWWHGDIGNIANNDPSYKVDGSFALKCSSTGDLCWSLRETPK